MVKEKSKRQTIREQRRRKQLVQRSLFAVAGLILIGVVGYAVFSSRQPAVNPSTDPSAAGDAVAIMPDSSHVADGTDPGPYNTDPPSSGRHYAEPLSAGFYDDAQVAAMGAYPVGHAVHSLEHGYVIFWYNCDKAGSQGCAELEAQLKSLLDQAGTKVIAFPWKSIDVPVVATSWGRMLRFTQFDTSKALGFVNINRNKSPEPNAP